MSKNLTAIFLWFILIGCQQTTAQAKANAKKPFCAVQTEISESECVALQHINQSLSTPFSGHPCTWHSPCDSMRFKTTVICENGHVQELRLTDKQMTYLSELTYFDLTFNDLTELPPEIGQLSKLHRLGLSNNQLKSLPTEMNYLSHLRVMPINGNDITSIPMEVCLVIKAFPTSSTLCK